MTIDEAIKELKDASDSEVRYGDTDHHYDEVMKRVEAIDFAIKALEQQPCEDCISRKETIEWLKKVTVTDGITFKAGFEQILCDIEQMPSVTPKYTDEEIDKAQAVEQAYVDKMVELAVKEWCNNGRK